MRLWFVRAQVHLRLVCRGNVQCYVHHVIQQRSVPSLPRWGDLHRGKLFLPSCPYCRPNCEANFPSDHPSNSDPDETPERSPHSRTNPDPDCVPHTETFFLAHGGADFHSLPVRSVPNERRLHEVPRRNVHARGWKLRRLLCLSSRLYISPWRLQLLPLTNSRPDQAPGRAPYHRALKQPHPGTHPLPYRSPHGRANGRSDRAPHHKALC